MAAPDLRAIALAGGVDARVAIIPTAAAPDQNHQRAGNNGMRWFQSLGATNVSVVPVIDRHSANDPAPGRCVTQFTPHLPAWRVHFLPGGDPGGQLVLAGCARSIPVGRADRRQQRRGDGAVPVPFRPAAAIPETGLEPAAGYRWSSRTSIPLAKNWVGSIPDLPAGVVQIGIDERTAAINDGEHGAWNVYGDGSVTIIRSA